MSVLGTRFAKRKICRDCLHSIVHHRYISTKLPQQLDLLERYRGLVSLGKIQYDEGQIRVIMQLRRIQRELTDYTPAGVTSYAYWASHTSTSASKDTEWWFSSASEREKTSAMTLFKGHAEELAALRTPKGLLLTGPPGSGKTFLVNLWFDALPTPYKARKHYNELVLEIYRAVWEITQERMSSEHDSTLTFPSGPSWRSRSLTALERLIPFRQRYAPSMAYAVAKRLILHHWLLVFDEIQLLDVSSASLLADVLSWFWRMGGVVVGTSNKVPEDLYKNGVQRERLEPFVEALKARCPVLTMETKEVRDWRIVRAEEDPTESTWFTVDQKTEFQDSLSSIVGEPRSRQLSVFGRAVDIPWVIEDACKFSFDALCAESLGPADYWTLASTFRTVIIEDVPILKLSAKDQARRFISLIDALYEARCRLIVCAPTCPEKIFFPDAQQATQDMYEDIMMAETVAETRDTYRPNVSSYDAPDMNEAPVEKVIPLDTLSIFSGKDEQFAFKRALSRLIEMTSSKYNREEEWSPLPLSLRKWETSSAHSTKSTAYRAAPDSSKPRQDDDYAAEAAYEKGDVPKDLRPPPELREYHIWGVREDWGKGAGRWGKGAKVYEDPRSNERT